MTAYPLRCHKCDDAEYPGARELCAHLYEKHGDLMDLTPEDEDTPWDAISQLRGADVMGDALLFSANAEIERLKKLEDAVYGACFDHNSVDMSGKVRWARAVPVSSVLRQIFDAYGSEPLTPNGTVPTERQGP